MKTLMLYLNPLYWPIWLLLGLLWLCTRLPYSWQLAMGRALGRVLYLFPSKMKKITQANLALCMPELSPRKQAHLAKANFENLGAGLLESCMAWWLPDSQLQKMLTLTGAEYAEAALAKGKGIILLSPHFTSLEMIARLIGMQYAFAAMYKPHKKKVIAHLLHSFRKKHKNEFIPSNRMHTLISALEANKPVWYAYDVDGGKKRSVFAPFFGIQTSSLVAVSRLAKMTGAAVVPFNFFRREDNSGYEIQLSPALENFPSDDNVIDATQLNACLETAVRKNPSQYIWQYKRFKTRPQGEARFYD
jgi:KDO2-lipid IV(A) lauroyltransferase